MSKGSRVKWRSGLGVDDGAPLYFIDCLCMHTCMHRIFYNCILYLIVNGTVSAKIAPR